MRSKALTIRAAVLAAAVMAAQPALTSPALAQTKKPAEPAKVDKVEEKKGEGWRDRAVDIGSQPGRDVGVMRKDIPPILQKAYGDPYSLKGLKTCVQLAGEVRQLNSVLGTDYVVGAEYKENRAGKLAEAGGKAVVNSIIPFRGLVREITGAAPADRQMNAAVDAGLARRGFLRGVHYKQGCKTKF